ncbi:PREDICTED: neugrin [Myotis davidii]|uniref:neugrin n=1 Tax=Myotis davidii TaxID=225400 RepID=UPI0003EBE9CA|nr:PREDICTED: neugrin [Myotis davidii]
MAGALSLLLGARVRAVVARCGFATQGVAGPGSTGREPDPDSDWEPEERELQEVERYRLLPGPSAWYLHGEFPESWSVPRLAEGFAVSTDVIRRVLKSKFVPTLEKKLKQDQKVLKKAGLAPSLRQLAGPGETWKLLSAGHPVSGGEASSQGQGHSTALKVIEPNTQSTNTPRRQTGRNTGAQSLEKESFVPVAAAQGHQRELRKFSTSDCEGTRGTGSDGSPSARKLEELRARELGDQNFSSKVVQRGREFFDDNGNFLYRI